VTEESFGEEYRAEYRKFLLKLLDIKKNNPGISLFCGDPLIATLDKGLSKYADDSSILGGCSAGLNSLAIDEKGDIRACTRLPLVIGNIREDNLERVWSNDARLEKLRDRENLNGKCGVCKYRWICGGCRAAAALRSGSYLGEDPDCFY
jgi:radical SAM protein with 4Fe4S-binding SPASM domain